MTIRKSHHHAAAASLVGLLSLGLFTPSCTSPKLLCDVASGPYVARYFPKDGGADCLSLKGELIGMKTYNPPSEDGENLDASKTTVAVQASSVGEMADAAAAAGTADPDKTHTLYSYGDYSNTPDADAVCSAGALSSAEIHVPKTAYTDGDGNPQVLPETRLVYAWKSLSVYTTFTSPGNAATGEVTITREVTSPDTGAKDTCTTTYIASALYPPVDCEVKDADDNGTGKPNDAACCGVADPAAGRPEASGINPDFKVKCDPDLLLCVLDWKPGEAFPPLGKNAACGASSN
ncbi:MAG: hypothetical protein U0441_22700 [Polyangiaceae bacterium]